MKYHFLFPVMLASLFFLQGCLPLSLPYSHEPWGIPERPTISEDKIEYHDGKICYPVEEHVGILFYIRELENRAKEEGAVRRSVPKP